MTQRRRLSPAQRRYIEAADAWVGWDSKGRPVVRVGLIEYALTRKADLIAATYPVERAP